MGHAHSYDTYDTIPDYKTNLVTSTNVSISAIEDKQIEPSTANSVGNQTEQNIIKSKKSNYLIPR